MITRGFNLIGGQGMLKLKFIAIIFCLVSNFVLLSMTAEATENKVSKSKAKATSKKIAQKSLVPFDTNIETLPVNFLGHDLKRIYLALSKSEDTFKKSEYESTDKYNTRLLDLKSKILLDNFTYGDIYVYVHKKHWSNKLDVQVFIC